MGKGHLKMADVFREVVQPERFNYAMANPKATYAAHAINSHDELVAEVDSLRQADKDAARYRWLMQNAKLGIGRNGKDWDLHVDGPAPDAISEVSEWIDNHV